MIIYMAYMLLINTGVILMKTKEKNTFTELKDSLKDYLKDISKDKLLSAYEEQELSKRILNGDKTAREKLINSNLRLVVKIAKAYATRGMDLLDLIQEGNLGLIRAADRFDFRKKARFSTYASFWIKQSIARAISNKGRFIRLPHRKDEKLRRLSKVQNIISREKGRHAEVSELAKETNLSKDEIKNIMNLPDNVVSFESTSGKEEGKDLYNLVSDNKYDPDRMVLRNYLREKATEILRNLSEKEKKVLYMRYSFFSGKKYTLKQIAKDLNTSPETIRQIEIRALKKIREQYSDLREFLAEI